MKKTVIFMLLFASVCFCDNARCKEMTPVEILDEYFKLPQGPKEHRARWDMLVGLKNTPAESVKAIDEALAEIKTPRQKRELITMLGDHLHNDASAAILCRCLDDSNENIRRSAVHGLRRMSSRISRSGNTRMICLYQNDVYVQVPMENEDDISKYEREPKVKGLLPYLIKAAEDESEIIRIGALYALAEIRQDEAVRQMEKMLKDESEDVRFYAACFLTEYNNASGLAELRKNLKRLIKADPNKDERHYYKAGVLIASFMRITGENLGEIPMDPMLSSTGGNELTQQYKNLLNLWGLWCQLQWWEVNRKPLFIVWWSMDPEWGLDSELYFSDNEFLK